MKKTRFSLRLTLCVLSILLSANLPAQQQQLVFTGLRAVASQGQFNAVQSAPNGDLYLLLDQKDGVRLLKTDATATSVLAQAQLGTAGDIGLAMALDPSGNVYITGTATSNALTATSGAAFPIRTGTAINSFIAKFDANLNPLFVTFTGSDRMAVTSIAATSNSIFITGSIFSATLPVTPSAIIPAPTTGSFQNGFVEKFNSNGDTLLYATYLSGANGDTAPATITADASGNAYLAGYTTSHSYPTFAALVPEILGTTSGFLTKLTPAGDGIVFSTFIPGFGVTSVALDTAAQNLLLSGTIALGQFPVATVAAPLVNTRYQTLLRMPLDGSAVLSSVLLAPGTQSFIAPAASGSAWTSGNLTTPLLSLPTLSNLGNSFALRVTSQNTIDQAIRFGGLPASNPAYASAPVALTSLAVDSTGQPIFAGAVTPTASASLLATQTFDLPLYNVPTGVLPSTIRDAVLSPGSCSGSLCAGSAAFLAKVNPLAGAPSLALSTGNSPNIILRNLGSVVATSLQLTATGFTLATNCAATLSPGAECSIALSGSGPGTLTVQAANSATQTATLPASSSTPDAIVFSPKELDFGIQTSASPAAQRTLTITNLSQQSQTFTSAGSGTQFAEQSSDCTASGTSKLLAPGGTCHITLTFTASSDSANDGIVQSNWTIGPGSVLLTGYTQAAALTLFTLTNLTSATVTITPPTTSGDFSISNTPSGGTACNGPLNPTASCFIQVAFNPSTPGTRTGILTTQTSASTLSAPLVGFGAPDTGLSLTPTSLTFDNVPGTASTQQIITLKNTGTATLQIATPTVATASFTPSTLCATLAPGATCTLNIVFTSGTANATDTLSIPVTSSITGTTTYTVPLIGAYTTEDSGLQIIPSEANFGPQTTGSAGLTLQFTINNLTAKSLTLALALPRQFVLAEPPCATLAPNASCTFSVTFLPLINGDITGTLFAQGTPADGSPTLNSLGYVEGYGLGSGALAISGNLIPTGGLGSLVDFGQVASGQSSRQTLTLTNHAASPITIRRILSEWPFLSSTTCGATLASNQACTVTVAYSPLNQATTGTSSPLSSTDTGTLVIESDALTSPEFIDLTGTAAPILVSSPSNAAPLVSYAASQSSLTFPSTSVGNVSPAQTVTLSNTGTRTIHIAALQTTPDFTAAGNCTTLVAGASCTLNLTFTPQLPGTRISALEISSDSSATLDFISLLGSANPSSLSFSPASLDFGTVFVGGASTLPLQVTNSSATPAIFNGIATIGDYAATGSCPTPGGTLAPSTSCTLQATFTPTHPGTRAGILKVSNSLSTLPLTVALTGIGAQSHLQANPSSFNFGSLALAASANLSLTLSNTGTAPITNLALAITGDYAITTPCALTSLAAGASCFVTLTFTPTALGARPGTLTVTSSDANSPTILPLTGTGVPNGTFTLTAGGNAGVTVKSGSPATYPLTLTPQNNFSGAIILNCTPITPGQYATCSLLPSSVTLNGAEQKAVATINTITSATTTAQSRRTYNGTLLCLLPAALLFFWRTHSTQNLTRLGTLLFVVATLLLTLNGCGSGGTLNLADPALRRTPPGVYQYQITATATTGPRITQTVNLKLTIQ